MSFLFWGMGSMGRKGFEEEVQSLEVRGKTISPAKFKESVVDAKIALLDEFISNNKIKTAKQFDNYQEWFNNMMGQINIGNAAVQQLLLYDEAKKNRIKVSQEELIDWIENFPLFQQNNVFNIEIYNTLIENYFRTIPTKFEQSLKRVLTTKKLKEVLLDTVLVSDEEAFIAYKDKNEKAVVYYVSFDAKDFSDELDEIEESDLEDYYSKNKEEFREPEKIKIAYLLFDPAVFKEGIVVEQKEIEDYYTLNQDTFKDEKGNIKPIEEVNNSITETLTDEKARLACQKLAFDISIDLTDDKRLGDMIKIAQENDILIDETDYLSRKQLFSPGLGWAPDVMKVAWQMDPESISDLFPLENKWAIISVKEKKLSEIPEFNKVKEIIRKKIIDTRAKELAKTKAEDTFNELPKDLPFTMEVKQLGLKINKSKQITRSNELFTLETGVIETPKGYALVSKKTFYPIDKEKWQEEKEKFKESYLKQKQRKFVQRWMENLVR